MGGQFLKSEHHIFLLAILGKINVTPHSFTHYFSVKTAAMQPDELTIKRYRSERYQMIPFVVVSCR